MWWSTLIIPVLRQITKPVYKGSPRQPMIHKETLSWAVGGELQLTNKVDSGGTCM